ncbi:cytochrome c oxidase assembly factor Coa1 family protein [Hyalangium versicolor]|uniref:cytochrome c oxidase assembly factor Coa1 family protein n=1 Tax=Hyalangium versicolor TaxID=2861190 RepID=UPI001CCC7455|nr:cytochrome c oxidase assembly factor Coa1 family protein [Hyalangium versicolor]
MTPEGNMAPQPSWWSRNWKWAVPVGCLGVMASCLCFGVIAVVTGLYATNKSPAAQNALAIAMADSEVQATLGTPIRDAGNWQSSVSYVNGQSQARFGIPLEGTKAQGLLRVEATKTGDDWSYQVLQVEVPGQPPIDLLDKVGGGSKRELAPPTPDEPPPGEQNVPDGLNEPAPPQEGQKNGENKPDINL